LARLGASASVGLAATAGCLGEPESAGAAGGQTVRQETTEVTTAGDGVARTSDTPPEPETDGTVTNHDTPTPTLAERGLPSDICEKRQQQPGGENIRAIVDPVFAADWREVSIPKQYKTHDGNGIAADAIVIGLQRNGRARAYPLSVVWWHEIVNDTFGVPTLVTYCPLCRSGMVAKRTVAGEPTRFTVTELLWIPPDVATNESIRTNRTFGVDIDETNTEIRDKGNLVLADDATGSYWSQLLAQAICGPRRGDRLEILPSRTVRWGAWKRKHPETDVLLPPPYSGVSII
jgi:hypothetical protein